MVFSFPEFSPTGNSPPDHQAARVIFYALYHLFGPDVRDTNGNPICEVYAFEELEELEEWLAEVGAQGERVSEEHPTVKALLGPSQVFDIDTPFRAAGEENEGTPDPLQARAERNEAVTAPPPSTNGRPATSRG